VYTHFSGKTMMKQDKESKNTKICPVCGTRVSENATRCLVCGAQLTGTASTKKAPTLAASKGTPEIRLKLPVAIALGLVFIALLAGLAFTPLLRFLSAAAFLRPVPHFPLRFSRRSEEATLGFGAFDKLSGANRPLHPEFSFSRPQFTSPLGAMVLQRLEEWR